jgi:GAF domain-containing protein
VWDDFSLSPEIIANDEYVASQLTVPILFSDKLLGVLSLESLEKARFDENDQEIMGALGNALGAIITNTELLAQIRRQIERQRQLYEITSKIRRSVDIETILRTSTTEIGRVMHARNVQIKVTAGQDNPAKDKSNQHSLDRDNENDQNHSNNGNNKVEIAE